MSTIKECKKIFNLNMKNSPPETVAEFAESLRLPVAVLIDQLKRAGMLGKSSNSPITDTDKSQLLRFLREAAKQPPPRKTVHIERLIDTGYLPASGTKGLNNDASVTEPEALKLLSVNALKTAYSHQDIKLAQALIELLPRKYQHSLAHWFNTMGLPCARLSHPLESLPNSLWMVCRPSSDFSQSKALELAMNSPPVLKEIDPYLSKVSDQPFLDDLQLEELGMAIKTLQDGITGLKR